MKILALFIFLIPLVGWSQNHWIGVQGSYNLMGFYRNSGDRYDRNPSYAAGVNYEWNYRNVALFGFDLLYNNSSYTHNYAVAKNDSNRVIHDTITYPSGNYYWDERTPAEYKIHFLSLPLKFGWHFGKKFRVFIIGGLGPNFALGGSIKFHHLVVNPNNEKVSMKIQKGKSVGIFGQLEVGCKYIIKERYQLFASARIYKHFIQPELVGEYFDGTFHTSTDLGNWGFNFCLGFKIALSKKPIEEIKKEKKEEKEKDAYEELYLDGK